MLLVFENFQNRVSDLNKSKFILVDKAHLVFSAIDPVSLSKEGSRLEIYKATSNTFQTLRNLECIPIMNQVAYLPLFESDENDAITEILAKRPVNKRHYVVSLDFYSPRAEQFYNSNYEIRSVSDFGHVNSLIEKPPHASKNGVFIGPNFEIPWSYEIVFSELSKIWREQSTKSKITLLLPNLDSHIRISALAFLGTWFADQVKVIGAGVPRFSRGTGIT